MFPYRIPSKIEIAFHDHRKMEHQAREYALAERVAAMFGGLLHSTLPRVVGESTESYKDRLIEILQEDYESFKHDKLRHFEEACLKEDNDQRMAEIDCDSAESYSKVLLELKEHYHNEWLRDNTGRAAHEGPGPERIRQWALDSALYVTDFKKFVVLVEERQASPTLT